MNNIQHTTLSGHVDFYGLVPTGDLAPYISLIWASSGKVPFQRERILPDGSSVLVFNFGSPLTFGSDAVDVMKQTLFAGIYSYFRDANYTPFVTEHSQAGIIFKPGGAFPFIRKRMQDFKNMAVDSRLFDDEGRIARIYEILGDVDSPQDRVVKLQQLLSAMLAPECDQMLVNQLINLIRNHTEKSIEDITRKTGYSQQQFNRILAKHAGVNAKTLQKIFRINQAMRSIKTTSAEAKKLTGISYEFGYFDQAHFIHDFKNMTGVTPGEYRKMTNGISNRLMFLY